mmetsp:Transcript_15102/g.35990  ORF Transcript_15102/g.35990 Transcript_15102/m.35990 type:complete len:263 (-) Transcript_15102:324-1112(-)
MQPPRGSPFFRERCRRLRPERGPPGGGRLRVRRHRLRRQVAVARHALHNRVEHLQQGVAGRPLDVPVVTPDRQVEDSADGLKEALPMEDKVLRGRQRQQPSDYRELDPRGRVLPTLGHERDDLGHEVRLVEPPRGRGLPLQVSVANQLVQAAEGRLDDPGHLGVACKPKRGKNLVTSSPGQRRREHGPAGLCLVDRREKSLACLAESLSLRGSPRGVLQDCFQGTLHKYLKSSILKPGWGSRRNVQVPVFHATALANLESLL